MEIDKGGLVRLMLYLFDNLEAMESDLAAYRAVFLAVKLTEAIPDLEESLEAAKVAPQLQQQIGEKYKLLRERVQQLSEQAESDQAFLEAFLKWKPQDPPN